MTEQQIVGSADVHASSPCVEGKGPVNGTATAWTLAATLMVLILVIDQAVKFAVKLQFSLREAVEVTPWFQLLFTENEGMAFGMDFIGTLFLTLFRIVAIGGFLWLLAKAIKMRKPLGLIACLALIIAGAAGNVIDNTFYGLIFTQSQPYGPPAQLVPIGQGYGSIFQGRVVDMFYFPLFTWPDWVPLLGGKVFFNAIFNFADACISCGAVILLLFYHRHARTVTRP